MKHVWAIAIGFCVVFGSAQEAKADFILTEALDVGVSGLYYASGSFLDDPGDSQIPYPGFAGFNAAGGGFAIDARYLGIVGLEIDLFFTEDRGNGEINDQDVTIGQTAIHLPILFKLSAPLAIFKPNLVIGWEFVFVDEAEADSVFPNIGAEAKDYDLFTFGLGFEIALPIPAVDIRIPLSLRGSVNFDTPDKIEDRVDLSGIQFTYNSEWKFHTGVSIGVAWYFL